jgi:hypothetical protein
MKLEIHIERLVLDGLDIPYHRQPELQGAVETELASLFTANVPANDLFSGGTVSHIAAGDISGADENTPGRLGRQIARAVYEGVSR